MNVVQEEAVREILMRRKVCYVVLAILGKYFCTVSKQSRKCQFQWSFLNSGS